MNRQIARGKIKMYNRHEMLDVVIVDGKARGIITRNLITGEIERHSAHAVVIASGGYGNVFFFLPMQWEVMLLQPGKFTKKEHFLQILVTLKFIQLVFQDLENINLN